MGILKSAADLVYTFRFLKLLVTKFEDTGAYEAGIIDKNGNRIKDFNMNTVENRKAYRDNYTPFHRLVFNIKKLMAKAPGGGSAVASYAAALYLIKEHYNLTDDNLETALKKANVDITDILAEQSQWFVLEDMRLSPGAYRLTSAKISNENFNEIARVRDFIRVDEHCYPVGDVFGINIYKVTHSRSNQEIYVTAGELSR